jgi:group I intron endonuclease
MKSGIYTITNLINNKIYVGSSIDIKNRLKQHIKCLKGNYHDNDYLQKSFNKYGIDNFAFEVLEYCDKNLCVHLEQYWMNLLNSYNLLFGFNLKPVAFNSLGYKHSNKTKEFLSDFRKLHPINLQGREKISKAHTSKKYSKEHKEAISKGLRNKPKSQQHKDKLRKCKFKTVYQYDLEDNFIKEWESPIIAAKALNFDAGNIANCARGKSKLKTYKNFKWKYNEIINSEGV